MSRWDDSLDSPWIEDGDSFFIGYNEKLHRSQLQPGFVAKSVNKRFTDGTAKPRAGATMPTANHFWYRSDNTIQFLGSFVYNNPNGGEVLILVPSGINTPTQGINAYEFDTNTYHTINFPEGVVINPGTKVWFTQGFNTLIMILDFQYHGPANHVTNMMSWDGDFSNTFQWFTWGGVNTTQVIAPSKYGWPVSNRIAYLAYYNWDGTAYHANLPSNHIIMSDIEDYQNYDYILADYPVQAGGGEYIVGVIPYSYDSIVVFHNKSVHMLRNFSLNSALGAVDQVTDYMGCVGVRAMIQVGQEIYFMSEKIGVFKLSEVLEQRLMAHPLPISDAIQPVIDRINWMYKDKIVAATLDNYLYWAVPLDSSTRNNAMLVYNTTTGNWETIDIWASVPNFAIDNLLVIHINDVRRLLAVQNFPALVYLLYEGNRDQVYFDVITPRFAAIPDLIETRGYGVRGGATDFKTFHRGGIAMETVNPNVKITAVAEGFNEEKLLRPSITKDRTKYYLHGITDYPNGHSWNDPKREDYSITGQPAFYAYQDFEQMPVGEVLLDTIPPPTVVTDIEPPQASRERFPIRVTDRWLSLRIENTQGQCRLLGTSVEATESKRNARTAA